MIVRALCFLVPLLALSGCQTTTEAGAVGAERQQFMLVSSAELEQIAAQAYTKLRTEAARKGVLNTDAAMLRRVRASRPVSSRRLPYSATMHRPGNGK
jgi:hypothetical protein